MKDKKAFIFFVIISVVLWQLIESVTKILTSPLLTTKDYGLFSISPVINKGCAFGMFQNNALILAFLGLIALCFIVVYVIKNIQFKDRFQILYLAIFSAGVLGNTYQRFLDGSVFDFIKLNFIEFPVFNLYDVLICSGLILYIFNFIKEEKNAH